MAAAGQQWINQLWYGGRSSLASLLLVPLSWLFALLVWLRQRLFVWGLLRITALDVPVVVVGNITVGGTGKTPVTIWLVNALADRGIRAGVVSRGYSGFAGESPLPVLSHSDPAQVGDEPVLIAERCGCPVVVHPDRVAAARVLMEQGVELIIADDGLQHYALARDIELAVVDGQRLFGNGRRLPAGPLRESPTRLAQVHRVLVNSPSGTTVLPGVSAPAITFTLKADSARRVGGSESRALSEFSGQTVHAVAAIGNPERFFKTLEDFDICVIPHPLPDHAELSSDNFAFGDGFPIFITEKDAVKCHHLDVSGVWFVPVDAAFSNEDWLDDIEALSRSNTAAEK